MELICRPVKNTFELSKCMEIRRKVFVEEQALFKVTDQDEYDKKAIHIVAIADGKPVGTVRVYEQEKGIWYGGRLAVLKEYRGNIGRFLVKKAETIVRQKKAKRFLAYIQDRNISFFESLGWKKIEGPLNYMGKMHYLMEARL